MFDAPGAGSGQVPHRAPARPGMRRPDGRPGARIRLLAALLALGLLSATAPLAVYPVAHWVGDRF